MRLTRRSTGRAKSGAPVNANVETVGKPQIGTGLFKQQAVTKVLDRNGNSLIAAPKPSPKAFFAIVELYGHNSTFVALCGF